jgi:CelD/BcsL family acetyltransferase involved in cellulose biosynthesis
LDRDSVTGLTIALSDVPDWDALGQRWRALEERSNGSFFQSWTWTGALAAERFPNPVLVEAREDGRTVALALFNRRGRRLYLGESGDPAMDDIYIEFNGVLTESGREAELTARCLRAARGAGGLLPRTLILSGIDGMTLAEASRLSPAIDSRAAAAPFADLSGLSGPFLDTLSANTRQQIRRSDRGYARSGPIAIDRAATVGDALDRLDALAVWHQKTWIARGRPGAFARPWFRRFHRAVITEGLPRGEIDLLSIAAGPRPVGFLYNFRWRGTSLAYQSGFDYEGCSPHEKPGLTCHHQAIQAAIGWGLARYDFLAGDDRYKRSLSHGAETLHWATVETPLSLRALARRARHASRALMAG